METVLLVGEPSPPDAVPSGSGRSASRVPASVKGALERVGHHVVNASDGAGMLRQLRVTTTSSFILRGHAAGRAARRASCAGADLAFPATVGPMEIVDRLGGLF
jgi:hypothetical protein